MISELIIDHFIRSWRIARLSAGEQALSYERTNILWRAGRGSRGHSSFTDELLADAELVQRLVTGMPGDVRAAFEARELFLVDGCRLPGTSNSARARALRIPIRTYWARIKKARQLLALELDAMLESA